MNLNKTFTALLFSLFIVLILGFGLKLTSGGIDVNWMILSVVTFLLGVGLTVAAAFNTRLV